MRHTLSGDSLGADAMGMGGAIRGAWEWHALTGTKAPPSSLGGIVNDIYQDNKFIIGLAVSVAIGRYLWKR